MSSHIRFVVYLTTVLALIIFLVNYAKCGTITYDPANDVIVVSGYKTPSTKTAWSFEDIYSADQANGWGKVFKYENPDSGAVIYVVKCHVKIEGGGEVGVGDPPNFEDWGKKVIWVDKSFIVMADAYIQLGRVSAEGYGYDGITLVSGKWYDVSWGTGPLDWRCIQIRGKARIYNCYIRPEDGRFSVTDDADVEIKDTIIHNTCRFASSNLKLIRVKIISPAIAGDFVEFTRTPSVFEDVTIVNTEYLLSFYQCAGSSLVIVHPKFINIPNQWSLPDSTNAKLIVHDAYNVPNPEDVVGLRGWNMENVRLHFNFTVNIHVTNVTGYPVADAIVTIIDGKGRVVASGLTDGSGMFKANVTAWKVIVSSSSLSDADVVKQFNSWFWNVYRYNPFTIVIYKYGFKPYQVVYEIKSPTKLLIVLGAGKITVLNPYDEPVSFAYAWVGPTHLKWLVKVKNPLSSYVERTPDMLAEENLFVRIPKELGRYLIGLNVSEFTYSENLGSWTQIDSNTWQLNLSPARDFSCDLTGGVVRLFICRLDILDFDKDIKVRLRAYTDENNYFEEERTLWSWHAWKKGYFYLMWAIGAVPYSIYGRVVGSPDTSSISKIEIYISDSSKISLMTSYSERIETEIIPRERWRIIDKGNYYLLLWWDDGNIFRIAPNSERRFIITMHPTPWLDVLRQANVTIKGDNVISRMLDEALNASFYFEMYTYYLQLRDYLEIKTRNETLTIMNITRTILKKLENKVIYRLSRMNETLYSMYNQLNETKANTEEILSKWGTVTADELKKLSEDIYTIACFINETRWGKYDASYIVDTLENKLLTLCRSIKGVVEYVNETRWGSIYASQILEVSERILNVVKYINETKWNGITASELFEISNEIYSLSKAINETVFRVREILEGSVIPALRELNNTLIKVNSTIRDLNYKMDSLRSLTEKVNITVNDIAKWTKETGDIIRDLCVNINDSVSNMQNIILQVNKTLEEADIKSLRGIMLQVNNTVSKVLDRWGKYTAELLYNVSKQASGMAKNASAMASLCYAVSNQTLTIAKRIESAKWGVHNASKIVDVLRMLSENMTAISSRLTKVSDNLETVSQALRNLNETLKQVNETSTLLKVLAENVKVSTDRIIGIWGSLTARDLYNLQLNLKKYMENANKLLGEIKGLELKLNLSLRKESLKTREEILRTIKAWKDISDKTLRNIAEQAKFLAERSYNVSGELLALALECKRISEEVEKLKASDMEKLGKVLSQIGELANRVSTLEKLIGGKADRKVIVFVPSTTSDGEITVVVTCMMSNLRVKPEKLKITVFDERMNKIAELVPEEVRKGVYKAALNLPEEGKYYVLAEAEISGEVAYGASTTYFKRVKLGFSKETIIVIILVTLVIVLALAVTILKGKGRVKY